MQLSPSYSWIATLLVAVAAMAPSELVRRHDDAVGPERPLQRERERDGEQERDPVPRRPHAAGERADEAGAIDAVPELIVRNRCSLPRTEIVRGTLPLPRGRHTQLTAVRVAGQRAPCLPMWRWPDGSLGAVQVHFRLSLQASQEATLPVELPPPGAREPAPSDAEPRSSPALPASQVPREPLAADGAAAEPPWAQVMTTLSTELEDPWGRQWTARFVPDQAAGPDGLVAASELVRVRRFVDVHRDPRGQACLALVAWLTTFAGERRAELTLLLDNGAHASARVPVLGPVRLRRFSLRCGDRSLRARPRFLHEQALPPPVLTEDGWRQDLLARSDHHYLGDRTAKAFRFDLFSDDASASEVERTSARAAALAPLWALPSLGWVRRTGAFGAHGGPAPARAADDLSGAALAAWRQRAAAGAFGPYGAFGDHRDAAAQGTPRNGDSALHNVLRWRSLELMQAAEGMVLQHVLRPPPAVAPRLPDATAPWREGLPPRAYETPHGWTPLDYEHFSVDLLYDWWWLSGDPLAGAELARMGAGLPRLLQGVPFVTCRGEGWCMQAGALIVRATGDESLLAFLGDRLRRVLWPRVAAAPPQCVLPQPPHELAFGAGEAFDAPWQMAAFVRGLAALHAVGGSRAVPGAAAMAVHTARVMAGPGWVEGKGPKYLVSATGADRYTLAEESGMGGEAASMQVGAFALAAEIAAELASEVANDPDAAPHVERPLPVHQAETFWRRLHELFAQLVKTPRPMDLGASGNALGHLVSPWLAADPWWQVALDRAARR